MAQPMCCNSKRLRNLGQELAGEIEAVGSKVIRFKAGDEVFAATLFTFGSYEGGYDPDWRGQWLAFCAECPCARGRSVLINGAGVRK